MEIELKKIEERGDAKNPNNIEVGHVERGEIRSKPTVGERFWVGVKGWKTSTVQEIIDERTFKTCNSVYRWRIVG